MTRPVRIALVPLAATAAAVLLAVGLVGGLAAAATCAAVLAALGLLAARWVLGAGAMDSDHRRRARLAASREPTLRYWDAALQDARLSPDGYGLHLYPLLLRLYEVRLAERHGVSLHTEPQRAAAIVGPELWPWIDPARPRTPLARRRASEEAEQAARSGRRAPAPRRTAAAPAPVPSQLLEALVTRLETL